MHERMLLAPKRPDCHERPRASLAFYSRSAISLLSDSEVQINQKQKPEKIVIVLVNHKIVDRNISMNKASCAARTHDLQCSPPT